MQRERLSDFLYLFHLFAARQGKLRHWLAHHDDDPARARSAGADAVRAAGLDRPPDRRQSDAIRARVETDLAWAEAASNHLICYTEPAYPSLLRQIPDYPLLIYACGDPALLQDPQIAIVGSRHCTPGGAQNAREFAAELAAGGLVVTSGLALGIDSHAHRGALERGTTLAVVATGLDTVYPQSNRRLAARIREQGLIVSEFPPGTAVRAAYFPQRNRIISGLSIATLVVEAARRSGSLITARLAAEQGRDVFAVPGSIHNPQSRGCHQLLRDGARLAESPADIAQGLDPLLEFVVSERNPAPAEPRIQPDTEQLGVLDAIGFDPVTTDTIVERSGLTVDKVSSMLVLLELDELIQPAPGGCYVRIQTRYR